MSIQESKVLILVGMHRSMTSLAAQWLQRCGLHMGDDLYGAGIGNVKGHYEDKDFISLHDYILKLNNSHWRDSSSQSLQTDDYSVKKSKMLIRLKSELNDQWGWKDPRNCLFLDHWNNMLPNAKYLIIYRPYAGVVDSLVRREFKVNNKARYLLEWRKYASKYVYLNKIKEENLRVWMHYNSSILDFVNSQSNECCIVIRNDALLQKSEQIFKKITEDWGFELKFTPVESIFDSGITEKATPESLKGVDEHLIRRAAEIQDQLAAYS